MDTLTSSIGHKSKNKSGHSYPDNLREITNHSKIATNTEGREFSWLSQWGDTSTKVI